jgi:sialidase-1
MHFTILFAVIAVVNAVQLTESTLVDVYTGGSDGYACYRIPAMSQTANGTLLLFSEGRFYDCNDHGYVDIVVKASVDGGATWGPLRVVHSESSKTGENVTIGNAAPVVLSSGRILLPFCRNNIQVGVLSSDDSGETWALLANIQVPSDWTWVATGPPGSLELGNGRVIIPANHIASKSGASHAFISDDGGLTWAISTSVPGGNEDQAAVLSWISPVVRGYWGGM